MTLSILHTESSIGWGGQEIRILTEMAGFLERGHRAHLLTPACGQLYEAAVRRGIPVTPIPMVKKTVPALYALGKWLACHAREFDVINTHSSTDSWLTTLARKTLRGMPPIVRTRHVSTVVNRNAGTRWMYNQAAHIVTTGEALRSQLHRNNGYALERMTSVPTGIDLTRFTPLDRATVRAALGLPDSPTLGILATLRDWKGHDYLLEAIALLRPDFSQWRILFIGDGPCRARLESRIAAMGLADTVRMVGNQDNVPEWLNALDLFVLPSYGDEGVPQSIMQAMACGLPVVSTPIGAIAEAVVADKTGFLVAPRDAAALAAGLSRFMRNPDVRATMGAAGLEHARAHFGVDVMLDKMTTVFRNACNQRRRA